MEKLAIAMLFMAAMSFLTLAASFAEPPQPHPTIHGSP